MLGFCLVLNSGFFKPLEGILRALLCAYTLLVINTDAVLSLGVASLCRLTKPFKGTERIFQSTLTIVVTKA